MITSAHEIAKNAYEGSADAFDILDDAERRIFEITESHLTKSYQGMDRAVREAMEYIETIHSSTQQRFFVPTGFFELDEIHGGLQKSDLVILAARPSIGKTALALSIARNAAIDHKVPVGICQSGDGNDAVNHQDDLCRSSAGGAFALICLILRWDVLTNWLIADAILLTFYFVGRYLPRASFVTTIGCILFFPVIFLLVAGSKNIARLPPVEMSAWGGLLLTLLLTIVGNIGSLPLGIFLALGRRSKLPIVRYFCIGYIELIRGVPLVTILYMADILLPLFLPVDVRPVRVIRAMVGFVLFEAAYQAENVRGGLQSINRGQYEAAQALGLNGTLTTTLIILPQALRAVIPALFNSFISLFKDTSLVAIIGLFDLLRIGRSVLAQTDWLGTHREVFLFAFLIYWGFNLAFTYGNRRVEKALGVGKR